MNIPTFSELYNSILNDLKVKLGITFILGKVVLNALAGVQAAKLKIIYTAIAFRYKNIFVDTADSETLGGTLERFGKVKLGRGLQPATAGVYDADVTGEDGAIIRKDTTFKSLDGSANPDKLFILDTDFVFAGTTGTIQLRALELGTDARLEVGDELQVTSPIANVDSYAFISNVVTTPTEQESYEDYRNAVIDAYQKEAQGGARTDYRLWSQDASGVREVYPYVRSGFVGEIDLFVEATVSDSTDGRGTPSASMLSDVEDVIEFDTDITKPLTERGRRPMGVYKVYVQPIIPIPVDVKITNLSNVSYLNDIKTAMETFLYDVRPYIAGADNINEQDKGKLYISDIFDVVRKVIGANETFTDISFEVGGGTYTIYEFKGSDIPYINTVTNV